MTPNKLRNDFELLSVVLFWAFNMTVIKVCLRELSPMAFNAVRFAGATVVLLILARWTEGSLRIQKRHIGIILLLAFVGHTLYQLFFLLGIDRTTASSTALIFGATPVIVGIMSRLAGHERIGLAGGAGSILAFYGVYLVSRTGEGNLGPGVGVGALLVFVSVVCWSGYTVLSKRLLETYSALRVTAVTLSIGGVVLIALSIPDLARQDWRSVSALTWWGTLYSLLFPLVVCYILWYRSVRNVGSLKTAVYSNLVPVFGAVFGILLLGEELTPALVAGGGCILAGIVLTRLPVGRGKPTNGADGADRANSGNPGGSVQRENGPHR